MVGRHSPVRAFAVAVALAAGPAFAACEGASNVGIWRLGLEAKPAHPLVGGLSDGARFWPPTEIDGCGVTAGERALSQAARAAKLVLLGEVHDNQAHHQLRAQWLAVELAADPWRGAAVAFEQVRADQQAGLDQFANLRTRTAGRANADDLKRALAWGTSAWSKMADYSPLFEAVATAGAPIYAADPPRDTMKLAAKQGGAAALSGDERKRLALDQPLGEANDAASLAEIDASHCGMIPKSAQPNMAQAQRYRDAVMADTLLTAADAHGSAVLIAGNGHVRRDRAVPWYIRARRPDVKVVSVMLVEVEAGKLDPQAYVQRGPDGTPIADFFVFTAPGADRDKDPCEGMRQPPAKGP